MPPLEPVLRPAMQAEDDVVAGAGFGVVKLDSARPHPMVRNALDLRQRGQCSAAAAWRKSLRISSIAGTSQGTISGQDLSGCSCSVFRPLPLITATTTSSGPILPSWASFAVEAIVVPPAGSVRMPSV